MKDTLITLWYQFRWNFLTSDKKKKVILSMLRHPANRNVIDAYNSKHGHSHGNGWN